MCGLWAAAAPPLAGGGQCSGQWSRPAAGDHWSDQSQAGPLVSPASRGQSANGRAAGYSGYLHSHTGHWTLGQGGLDTVESSRVAKCFKSLKLPSGGV